MHRDPFYDLFHKKTVDSLHITLISEGGNSLSKSPSPVCIDSLQVAHTCTAESQHLIYRSASSAHARYPAAPIGSLFTLPLDCAPGLDQGNIPEALRCGLGRLGLDKSAPTYRFQKKVKSPLILKPHAL